MALGISQKEAALAAGVGWRTIQRIDLDERAQPDIRDKVKAEYERRGVVFLPTDETGWGIRLPKGKRGEKLPPTVLKVTRIGLGLSVEEVASDADIRPKKVNEAERDAGVADEHRDRLRNALVRAGATFLTPTGSVGWGFRIAERSAPEHGRVLLERASWKANKASLEGDEVKPTEPPKQAAAVKAKKASPAKKAPPAKRARSAKKAPARERKG